MKKISLFLIVAMTFGLISCGGESKKEKKSEVAMETTKENATIRGIKERNENLVKVKNAYADVYSLFMSDKRPTVFVLFNSNNTRANMQSFMQIIDETAEKLVKKYQDYVYYAYDYDNELVLGYDGSPSHHIFSVEGIHFYVNGSPSDDMGVDCPYRSAYANIVKEKRGVETLTEWDYYMFRNKLDFEERKENVVKGQILIGTSALMEVAKTDWDMILNDESFKINIEEFIGIYENAEEIQDYLKKVGSYGIIWFDEKGQRVMAEKIGKTTGKIERDRRWYNGYKGPK